ncbi:RHO1 GDP-GTP exchange protein 2, variant 2, partial [Basidiobolus ranarum]
MLFKLFIAPLQESEIISPERQKEFITRVFQNYQELQTLHVWLLNCLKEKRVKGPVIDTIGDVFSQFIDQLEPYVRYGVGLELAQKSFENEAIQNTAFSDFLEVCVRHPDARRLTLQSFLSRPTSRLGRYVLLLENLLKYTPKDHRDASLLEKSIMGIKKVMTLMNDEAGKVSNSLRLQELDEQILFKDGIHRNLCLGETNRQLIRDGSFRRKHSGFPLKLFLFDHVLLLTKEKQGNDSVEYHALCKPIPLELITFESEIPTTPQDIEQNKSGFPFTFTSLSKPGGKYTLYASSPAERKQWVNKIKEQKVKRNSERITIFDTITTSNIAFDMNCQVNCATTYVSHDNRKKLVIGTDIGIYIGFEDDPCSFKKTHELERVRQICFLTEFNMVLVLQDKLLVVYSLDAFDFPNSPANRHSQKLASHVSY